MSKKSLDKIEELNKSTGRMRIEERKKNYAQAKEDQ